MFFWRMTHVNEKGGGGGTYEATHNPFCLTANLSLELAETLILDADV